MKILLSINGQVVDVEASVELYHGWEEMRRKDENLRHEQRRHWDSREFDERIILREGSHLYYESPEQRYLRMETLTEIQETLASCTQTQRERFLLHALDGLSYAKIAGLQRCSKYAVRESVEAVRKKFQKNLGKHPHESHFSGL